MYIEREDPYFYHNEQVSVLVEVAQDCKLFDLAKKIKQSNNFTSAEAYSVYEFAKKNNIIIAHDAAYSEIYYDNKKPYSFLNVEGAKDVGI